MAKAGQVAAQAVAQVLKDIKVGVTLAEIDQQVEELLTTRGITAGFKLVPGYQYASCVTVGADIVHGIPTDYRLQSGDVVSVDVGGYFGGLHTDCAWTVQVGTATEQDFLTAGRQALAAGSRAAVTGNRLGDIGAAIEEVVRGAGYFVVRELVGHGVGKELHEDPQVPGYGRRGVGQKLVAKTTLAIEVIYTKGKTSVARKNNDGWTLTTADGSLSGLFEETIVVEPGQARVLTPIHEYL